jgi:hypothetical protein
MNAIVKFGDWFTWEAHDDYVRKHGLRAMVQNIWTKDTGPDTMEDRTRIMIQDTKNRAITIVVNS